MCKYCDKDIVYEEKRTEDYTTLEIENFHGEVYIRAYGGGCVGYMPKYCPECGRKLKDETDTDD